jgi:hypothetical protein
LSKKYVELIQSSLQNAQVEFVLALFTTLLAENTRRKVGLKLLEANTVVAFEDGRANVSPGMRSLLDPARYGFIRALPALNDEITTEMTTYAQTVEAAEASLKVLKDLVAAAVKALKKHA